MTYTTNKCDIGQFLLLIFINLFSVFAFGQDTSNCVLESDIYGKPFQLSCFDNNNVINQFYIDSTGKYFSICQKPDVIATFWDSESEFNEFVRNNLEWPKNFDGEGRITAVLFVDTTGEIIETRILNNLIECPDCIDSVQTLLIMFPKGSPAIYDNRPVHSIKKVTIFFD